ncbi:MAG: ATP-binding protein [Chloroflexota bacterium]|nr:ATP-binding protein [Chloroflexota bacterium]
MPRRPRWRGRGLTYRRQVILVMVVVAILPVAVFGVAALSAVEDVVGQEALAQTGTAVRGVGAVLGRDAADLAETVDSYANWPLLQDEVAKLALDEVRKDVIEFQVDQGEIDAIALIVGDRHVVGGPEDQAIALAALARRALARPDGASARPTYTDLGDGVYLVAFRPIALGDRTGPGVTAAAGGPVGLAFARRLDPAFVVDARAVTGFDGAVFDRSGRLRVASDEAAALVFAPDVTSSMSPEGMTAIRGGLAGGWLVLNDVDGQAVGWFVATMRIEGIQTVARRLGPLLAAGLGLAVMVAATLAVLLGRRLRLSLDAIGGGLSAIVAGDRRIRLPANDRDAIGRLAATIDRLGETLDQRDRILREATLAVAQLTPDLGVGEVQARGVAAAGRIFGLADIGLEAPDGNGATGADWRAVLPAGSASEGAGLVGRSVWASLGQSPDSSEGAAGLRLTGQLPVGRDWSEADQSLFDVYARLLRAAIDDAAVHARTLDRVDRLDRLTRLQSDFLRGVSHNLQAPLTNIVVVADELATADGTDAHAREGAAVIRAQANRLARLVGQLLTLSRLEAGTLRVEAEPVAPEPIIRRVWSSLGSDRPFQVEDRSSGMVAVADRAALEQVVWMLLDNALKYAPSGAIGVSLESADEDERVAITVWDEGPGIAPDERARVFRRFERGSTSQGLDGTGLGLDVARGLVRAMGGQIRYVSAPKGGAGFRFTLPGERSERPA